MTRYTYSTCLSFGTDGEADYCEMDVTVSFAVIPGEPETGPTYACGGTPAGGAEIVDIELDLVDGRPAPWGLYDGYITDEDSEFERFVIDHLESSERHGEAMLSEAAEADAADRDAAAEYRAESRGEA